MEYRNFYVIVLYIFFGRIWTAMNRGSTPLGSTKFFFTSSPKKLGKAAQIDRLAS